jgi:ribosomal protein S17E
VIFGSEHFKEMIGETDTEISEKFNENHFLQEKLAEVQSKIEVLQPEVEKWQR